MAQKMYQTIEHIGGVSFHQNFTMNHGDLRHAMLYAERHYGATLIVNGYVMPSMDDDTFFYASVKAAEEGKVWVEEAHAFMSLGFKSALEGGCIDDLDKEFEEFGGWDKFVLDNIYTDIFGYEDVTGEDGQAIVRDEDVADLCMEHGYEVLHYITGDPNEDYWIIVPQGGEEEYSEDEEEDDIFWEEDRGTKELCFEAPTVHAYFDQYDEVGSICFGVPSRRYGGFKIRGGVATGIPFKFLEGMIRTALDDPDDIEIKDGVVYRRLEVMPFDCGGCHATGWEYFNGQYWQNEYEPMEE